jgi:hypothetical protein
MRQGPLIFSSTDLTEGCRYFCDILLPFHTAQSLRVRGVFDCIFCRISKYNINGLSQGMPGIEDIWREEMGNLASSKLQGLDPS